MKYNELKDAESLRIMYVYSIQSDQKNKDTYDPFVQYDIDDCYQYEENISDYNVDNAVNQYEEVGDVPFSIKNIAYNVIYTDGNIKDISNIETSSIESFYCHGTSMDDANTLISKDITFENYSYIIEYFVINAEEPIISDPIIYLKNKNDETLIEKVKEVLKQIESEYNKKLMNSFYKKDNSINEETLNVYRLKR